MNPKIRQAFPFFIWDFGEVVADEVALENPNTVSAS
jgi:hypothetical protein